MLKRVSIAFILSLMGITLVVILYNYSRRNNGGNNGFERVFLESKAKLTNSTGLGVDRYSFIDVTPKNILLFAARRPYNLIEFSITLNNIKRIKLPFDTLKDKFEGRNSVAFNNGSSVILTGKTSMAYKIDSGQKKLQSHRLDSLYFYHAEIINQNSFLYIRKIQIQKDNRREIKKVDWTGHTENSYLFKKVVNEYFVDDGQFKYDHESKLLIYLFYYKGAFMCLNSNLNLVYQVRTIDTIKTANIHPKHFNDKIIHSSPPNLVNKRFCLSSGKIYVNSAVKADNEKAVDFREFQVIDVYSLTNGKYFHSFYLPNIGGQKLTDFRILNSTLIGIYNHTLAIFEIPKF